MMRDTVLSLRRLMLLAVLTVALVATGFAHRLPSTDDAALAAYALAGGDIADLERVERLTAPVVDAGPRVASAETPHRPSTPGFIRWVGSSSVLT